MKPKPKPKLAHKAYVRLTQTPDRRARDLLASYPPSVVLLSLSRALWDTADLSPRAAILALQLESLSREVPPNGQ